jgi:class 3 adenylate cyclase
MAPKVRYTQSFDGLHIAYCEIGEGAPLVVMPSTPLTHVQLEWGMQDLRTWYERLVAAGHRLIRYDSRGMGLSDRDVQDFSIQAQMSDMDAVAAALDLQRFALYASMDQAMVAIAWAAANPDRVSHLILWCGWASRPRVSDQSQTKALRALLDQDYVIYTETVARVLLGWQSEEVARDFAAFYRQCADPEGLRRLADEVYTWDVTDCLPRIACPTLVALRSEIPTVPVEVAREMARAIPGAHLVVLEGRSPLVFAEDSSSLLREITEFLGSSERDAAPVASPGGAPVTILFTDIEGSTELTQRLGDAAAQEVLHVHNRIVRAALASHGGTEIKHTGDGLMASFVSPTRAVEAALDIQLGVGAHSEAAPDRSLSVRVGLNAGDPVAERGDYFGTAVQLAARICGQAAPGTVLVSSVVRDLTAGKGFLFADIGKVEMKGFEEPVHLFEVHQRT